MMARLSGGPTGSHRTRRLGGSQTFQENRMGDSPEATQELKAAGADVLREIPLSSIVLSGSNPRQNFDQHELDRLAHAIKTRGFDHPILVKPAEEAGQYELIDGERRFRAAQQIGRAPCVGRGWI